MNSLIDAVRRANIIENATGEILLIVVLMVWSCLTVLNFKWRGLIKIMPIFYLSGRILTTMLYAPAEAKPGLT